MSNSNQIAILAKDTFCESKLIDAVIAMKPTKDELDVAMTRLVNGHYDFVPADEATAFSRDNWRIHALRQVQYALGYNIEVGMGATVRFWSDRVACTVVAVSKNRKHVTLQSDKATIDPNFKPDFHPGGFCGHVSNQGDQTYTYERNPEGQIFEARLGKHGRWYVGGKKGLAVTMGERSEFYDYNF